MRTILYFQATGKDSARQKLEGVYAYGRERDWDVQVIEPGASERKATELVRFWEPDGVIVECGSEQNHFASRLFAKTPVVFLDRNPKALTTPAFCVTHDSDAAASRAGLNIPDGIALVGVDNDELLCENTKPTLSSVMPDFRSAGEKAAAMLARLMANPKCRPTAETFGPLKLVRRTSTNRSKRIDRDVLAALDLIRREACNGLKARDVFASFACTRRMAEIRFRAATGKSPLEAIQEVRHAKAKELLKDSTRDRNAIANLCGYSSANALANFLRRFADENSHRTATASLR